VSPDFYRAFYRTDRQAVARVGPAGHRTARRGPLAPPRRARAAAGRSERFSLGSGKGQADAVARRTAAA